MTGATLTCQSQLVEVKGQFRRAASPSGMSVQVVRLFVANTFTCQSVSMVLILIFLRTFLERIFSMSNSGQRVEIAVCKDWKLVYALNHLQLKRLYLYGVEIKVLI